jgi:DNA-binding transcriptional LysR family regulator
MITQPMADADLDRHVLMEAVLEAARRRSFVGAAHALGVTPSTLGRRIERLERRLGVALFARSTRRVALTEAGAAYLPLCEAALAAVEEAEAAARSLGGRPAGRLRVTAPTLFTRVRLAPALPRFLRAHPDLRVELIASDAYLDLIEERLDVAVRIGALEDSALRARTLAPNVRRIVAAPSYLAAAPALARPEDLLLHPALHFARPGAPDAWTLRREGAEARAEIRPLLRSDDAETLLAAATAGLGVALLSDLVTEGARARGALVEALPGWSPAPSAVHAVWVGAAPPPKTRAFVDFLAETLRGREPPAARP